MVGFRNCSDRPGAVAVLAGPSEAPAVGHHGPRGDDRLRRCRQRRVPEPLAEAREHRAQRLARQTQQSRSQ